MHGAIYNNVARVSQPDGDILLFVRSSFVANAYLSGTGLSGAAGCSTILLVAGALLAQSD